MRVLIVNTSERAGGAAVAANRMMDALNNNGVKAKMLVRDKVSDDITVVGVQRSLRSQWNFLWERWCIFWHLHFSRKNLFGLHRQHRFRHHLLARVQGGGCHPFALDQPRYVVAQEYPKDYQQR